MTLEFTSPLALTLLPMPLVFWLWNDRKSMNSNDLVVPRVIVERISSNQNHALSLPIYWRLVVLLMAWIALVFGLAGPRAPVSIPALPAHGRDIILAVDLSGSMMKRDFELDGSSVSRLELVKQVATALIRRREGDRIGLVIFAEKTYAASPLSFDTHAVAQTLNEMEIGLVGRSTAIGEGLGLSLKRLLSSPAPTRIVILLSDGSNNSGSSEPAAVAELAKKLGIKVYTIGLGLEDTASSPESRDAVDYVTLQRVAEISGGAAFRAKSSADLDQAMHSIEGLVAGSISTPPTIIFHEFWLYLAAASLAACVIATLGLRTSK